MTHAEWLSRQRKQVQPRAESLELTAVSRSGASGRVMFGRPTSVSGSLPLGRSREHFAGLAFDVGIRVVAQGALGLDLIACELTACD